MEGTRKWELVWEGGLRGTANGIYLFVCSSTIGGRLGLHGVLDVILDGPWVS